MGSKSLEANTTGGNNSAFGKQSLSANTTASYNTAVGNRTLYANTTGEYNTATGSFSLTSNTTGIRNTASGSYSLYSNTTGEGNTASGSYSLYSNTTGSRNTAVGQSALYDANRTADVNAYNTAIGYNAGNSGTNDITTGQYNVLLGASTAASQATASNQIVIGYGATGHGDNIAVIGNGSNTAIHPHDNNEVDLGSSSYKFKNLHLAGSAIVGVTSTITSNTTFNGSETIVPVNGAVTITIDSDQKVAGRILIFKSLSSSNQFTLATEGSEQIQGGSENLGSTFQTNRGYQTVHLFCDGSNWYDLNQ